MTVDSLAATLLRVCEKDGDTAYCDALEAQARTGLAAGKGTVGAVNSASGNGKSVGLRVDLTPADTLEACLRASSLYNDTETPQVVLLDFSRTLG